MSDEGTEHERIFNEGYDAAKRQKGKINPDYYKVGGIETRDYLLAKLGVEGYIAYCYGNLYKYSSRAPHKGVEIADLEKMIWYANDIIHLREEQRDDPRDNG
jgi:hypothetical protein